MGVLNKTDLDELEKKIKKLEDRKQTKKQTGDVTE